MSLFNLLQGQLIEKPKDGYNYRKVLKEKEAGEKTKKEKTERKELCGAMKEKMSKEEFSKWRAKEWYQRNKKKRIQRQLDTYYRSKDEQERMLEEIYEEIYDPLPEPINYDKYYTAKFRGDDVNSENKYKFCWRSSKLIFENWGRLPKRKTPFRIYGRKGVKEVMNVLVKQETRAYQLLLPHLSELEGVRYFIQRHQTLTKYPLWSVYGKLAELVKDSDIPPSHICNVLSAIQRDKYIASEVYLGRTNFIVGDVLVTQTGNMFQICLENNLPWLTPQNVEQIHETRMKWWKKKGEEKPPIYLVEDAYLVKYQLNERETQFYIIPR